MRWPAVGSAHSRVVLLYTTLGACVCASVLLVRQVASRTKSQRKSRAKVPPSLKHVNRTPSTTLEPQKAEPKRSRFGRNLVVLLRVLLPRPLCWESGLLGLHTCFLFS
eukprot:RCo039485